MKFTNHSESLHLATNNNNTTQYMKVHLYKHRSIMTL